MNKVYLTLIIILNFLLSINCLVINKKNCIDCKWNESNTNSCKLFSKYIYGKKKYIYESVVLCRENSFFRKIKKNNLI